MMRADNKTAVQRYWAVLTLVVVGAAIGAWHNFQVRRGRSDYVTMAVRTVITPPAAQLGRLGRWLAGLVHIEWNGRALALENARLLRRVAELEAENARLQSADANQERLRAALNFVTTQRQQPIAAEVCAKRLDAKYDTIIISRGARDGVHRYSLVMSPEGVVGYVLEVDPITSTVVLLTDQNAGIGARVVRGKMRVAGICHGTNNKLLSMTDLERDADVKPGDLVVTSGLSRLFPGSLDAVPPKDLIIGTVQSVMSDPATSGKRALVLPKVNYDALEEVYVLK